MREARRFATGCVASPHYLASFAGAAVLSSGGNALDAAVATNLVLGVVTPYMCGYGGDLFAMIFTPEGGVVGYNGSGRSSKRATLDAVRRAVGSDEMPARGPHTVTVPGAVEAWFSLLERYGTRSFAELAQPALAYARNGVPLTRRALRYVRASLPLFSEKWGAEWRRIYGATGQLLFQTDLARTITALADHGPDVFYRGPIAEAITSTLEGFGALFVLDDLAHHRGDWVAPLASRYRDRMVYELPPNSQGVAALEALNVLERLEVGEPESAGRHHALIEATKIALADRDAYVTDPDHMAIEPERLASKAWAAARAQDVDAARAAPLRGGLGPDGGTVYLCAADSGGMLVSLIQSNYVGFGSGVTVPGWGINLQNRGAFFSLDPGHANVIAPAKRTLHTLMPAMAFREEQPWLVFGTMGGDGQAQTHVQVLTRIVDDGLDIEEALHAPRWVVSPRDGSVAAEARFPEPVLAGLRERGHVVSLLAPYDVAAGHAHAIEVLDGAYAASADPRSEGAALGS